MKKILTALLLLATASSVFAMDNNYSTTHPLGNKPATKDSQPCKYVCQFGTAAAAAAAPYKTEDGKSVVYTLRDRNLCVCPLKKPSAK